jgi:predicted DNA-binding transcriptional regulator AlpA
MVEHTVSTASPKSTKHRVPAVLVSEYDARSKHVSAKFLPLVVGISAITAWRMRKRGQFPEPVRLSQGRIAWLRSDLEHWLNTRERGGVR